MNIERVDKKASKQFGINGEKNNDIQVKNIKRTESTMTWTWQVHMNSSFQCVRLESV